MNRELVAAIESAIQSGSDTIDLLDITLDEVADSIDDLRIFSSIRLGGIHSDSLPDAIFALDQVRSLYIERSTITKLPDALGNLTNLHELYISCCPYFRTLPDEIRKLSHLESLFLFKNGINVLPPSIGELPNLHRVAVTENELFEVPDFASSSAIIELNLSGNRLNRIPSSIYSMRQLQILNLSANRISESSFAEKNFQNVSWLNLSRNSIHNIASGVVWDTIIDLDLSFNSLHVIPKVLLTFPKLKLLNLTGNSQLTRSDFEAFQREVSRLRPSTPITTIFSTPFHRASEPE